MERNGPCFLKKKPTPGNGREKKDRVALVMMLLQKYRIKDVLLALESSPTDREKRLFSIIEGKGSIKEGKRTSQKGAEQGKKIPARTTQRSLYERIPMEQQEGGDADDR